MSHWREGMAADGAAYPAAGAAAGGPAAGKVMADPHAHGGGFVGSSLYPPLYYTLLLIKACRS